MRSALLDDDCPAAEKADAESGTANALALLRWRIIPLLWGGQLLSYVVRNNIAFAELQMGPALVVIAATGGAGAACFGLHRAPAAGRS